MDGRVRKTLHIVTSVEEYDVYGTYVYTDPESARRKFLELGKEMFDDQDITSVEQIEDYQHSEEWWDSDERSRVSMITVLGETNEDY